MPILLPSVVVLCTLQKWSFGTDTLKFIDKQFLIFFGCWVEYFPIQVDLICNNRLLHLYFHWCPFDGLNSDKQRPAGRCCFVCLYLCHLAVIHLKGEDPRWKVAINCSRSKKLFLEAFWKIWCDRIWILQDFCKITFLAFTYCI